SFVGSNATTVAPSVVLVPNGLTAVSLSPATTCAAVTTVCGAATQPEPSMPSPHAVPTTRTTLGAAARTPGRRRTAGLGGGTSAGGPARGGKRTDARHGGKKGGWREDRFKLAQNERALTRLPQRARRGELKRDDAKPPGEEEPRRSAEQQAADVVQRA